TSDIAVVERQGNILGAEASKIFLETATKKSRIVLDKIVLTMRTRLGITKEIPVDEPAPDFQFAYHKARLPTGNEVANIFNIVDDEIEKVRRQIETAQTPAELTNLRNYLNRCLWT